MRRRLESLPGLGSRRSRDGLENRPASGGRLKKKGLKRAIGQRNRGLGARVSGGPAEPAVFYARNWARQDARGIDWKFRLKRLVGENMNQMDIILTERMPTGSVNKNMQRGSWQG